MPEAHEVSGWSPLGGSPRGTQGRQVKQLTNKRKGRGASPKTLGEIGPPEADAQKEMPPPEGRKGGQRGLIFCQKKTVGSEGVESLRLERKY